ncbi:LysR substrate-binding domain-containing protein [Mesoterricola sediminis]|uniref:LysR family transcriptional regulator n=1 Tax=Mesoterricola sediminis TaxID=2927980 RepID=A0AA48KF18_9BACT|nr:LysR substrate-binding domain-containing protein [Mesoterricola sediminis]BDU76013.1 LysR family transcriptional regulator [Mesoterricola sediminis]
MKLHQLEAFRAAVETGSIRAAARRMSLSQSALTKALKELEQDLDTALIHRSVRGIQLTVDGRRLLARADLMLRQAALARAEIQQAKGADEGSVAVGVTPLVALTVLPHAVAAFRRTFKHVKLHVVEGLEGIALPGVRQGHLDFGVLVIAGEAVGEDLAFEHWFRASNAVVLREGHPCAGARRLKDLQDQEWLATSFGTHGLGTRLLGYFSEAGLPAPARILKCESVLSALSLVRNTDVITFMPMGLLDCPETQGIRAVALQDPPPPSDIGLITRVDVPLTPVARAFADLMKHQVARWCASPAGRKGCGKRGA